uniref:Solute carrier family 17 member 9a n=1 Tax=Echeneis naucrates TaxID=173247 RepID=A0A665T886_ECHNA
MADEHKSGNGRNGAKESTEDARRWITMLFISTCLLYCARMAMPICAITMATTFHWSKIESGLVLGGFLWGYCFTQILGGHASDKIGGERVLFISVASWALITAGTPFLVQLGSHTLALMTMARFLMGLLQGVFFPSLASLCSQRVVEGERGFIMSTMNSGSHLGTLLAAGLGSMILDCCGWESVFYGIGILTALWALVVWKVFLKGKVTPKKLDTSNKLKWSSMDWLRLFKKAPVCAMVFAHMCVCSTSYTLLSWLPTYFEESFPHSTVWVYNVVPWLTAIPSALVGGYIKMSVLFVPSCLCSYPPSVLQILMSSLYFSGVSVNVQDLAPSCAGALYGFMNTLGAFMGLVLVSLSGYLIEVTMSWNSVFSLITIVNTTGLVIFLLFGDAGRVDLENSRLTVCDT